MPESRTALMEADAKPKNHRVSKIVGGMAALAVVGVGSLAYSTYASRWAREQYDSYAAAADGGLAGNGRLPSFAPRTATLIRVRFDREEGTMRGIFRIPVTDRSAFESAVQAAPDLALALPSPHLEMSYDDWWPASLRVRHGTNVTSSGFNFYQASRCPEAVRPCRYVIAADWSSGTIYFWSGLKE